MREVGDGSGAVKALYPKNLARRQATSFFGGAGFSTRTFKAKTVAAIELLRLGEARWFSGSSPTLPSIGGMVFQKHRKKNRVSATPLMVHESDWTWSLPWINHITDVSRPGSGSAFAMAIH